MKTSRTLVIAALLAAAPATALAQAEKAAPGTAVVPADEDPSQDFNWTDHLSPFGSDSYKNYDAKGGPMGDGVMRDEQGRILVDEHGKPLEEEPMSVPFVYFLLNFGVLLVLLGWKAGPIARDMASKRSDEIKNALDEAARLRSEAQAKLDSYSSKLKAAEAEIDDMIKAMRDSAEAEKQRIIAAAEAQAAALKKEAEERIAAEIDRARHALQQEVVAAAAAVAEKVLREKTTPTDQSGLVDHFIRGIA